MNLSPDESIYWQYGFVKLNATIVCTWLVMAILTVGSWLVTRRLSSAVADHGRGAVGTNSAGLSRWQNPSSWVCFFTALHLARHSSR